MADQNIQKQNTSVLDPKRENPTYVPRVDMYETDAHYVIELDLPGAESDDISVDFEDQVLSVHAVVAPRAESSVRYAYREYGVGDYHREFRIGEDIDPENIAATYRHGVLKLELPKRAAARRRAIEIKQG
jgi:HSP20 family protein